MSQQVSVEDVQSMINTSLSGIKTEVSQIKLKLGSLESKLTLFMKRTNFSSLKKILKDFNDIKLESDRISKLVGTIDMNDLSVVVDVSSNQMSFNIGDFTFSSAVKVLDNDELTIRPEMECQGAKEDYLERYEFVKIAGVDPWDNFVFPGKQDGRTMDMTKCKKCQLNPDNTCSILK